VRKPISQLVSKAKSNVFDEEKVSMDDLKRAIKEKVEMDTILKAAGSEQNSNPISLLKDAGLDLHSITSGLKEVSEVYKGLAEYERNARVKSEEEVKEARQEVQKTQAELLRTELTGYLKEQQAQIRELVEKLGEKSSEKSADPFTQTLQEIGAQMLRNQLQNALGGNTNSKKSVEEELLDRISFSEKIKERLGISNNRENLIKEQAMSGQIKAEILKMLLEDEREREKAREQIRLEKERLDTIKSAANSFGGELSDLLGAFVEAFRSTGSSNNISSNTQSGSQYGNSQGVSYQCGNCNNIFTLSRYTDKPICPYCGVQQEVAHSGVDGNNQRNISQSKQTEDDLQ